MNGLFQTKRSPSFSAKSIAQVQKNLPKKIDVDALQVL